MKISIIKSKKEKETFDLAKSVGVKVIELTQNEDVDKTIEELINNDYKNIILTNQVAGFSEDIIKKYGTSKDINIYIAPSKRNK